MRILALLGIVVCVTGGLIAASAPAKIPASINWVERGVVPPVRDQGACGGDYAYVTASSVGSLQAIYKKGKVFVSEQQLLDCASAYGGQGCRGGQLETGFQYIIANGATTRESYPVTGDSGECKVNGGAIKIKAYKNLPAGDCKALEFAVARQPVMAVVDGMSCTITPAVSFPRTIPVPNTTTRCSWWATPKIIGSCRIPGARVGANRVTSGSSGATRPAFAIWRRIQFSKLSTMRVITRACLLRKKRTSASA